MCRKPCTKVSFSGRQQIVIFIMFDANNEYYVPKSIYLFFQKIMGPTERVHIVAIITVCNRMKMFFFNISGPCLFILQHNLYCTIII